MPLTRRALATTGSGCAAPECAHPTDHHQQPAQSGCTVASAAIWMRSPRCSCRDTRCCPTRSTSTWSSMARQPLGAGAPGIAGAHFAVFSFGKTLHATGWRVGYCVAAAADPELRKVHQFNTFTISTPLQRAIAQYLGEQPGGGELSQFFQAKRDPLVAWPVPPLTYRPRRALFSCCSISAPQPRRRRLRRKTAEGGGRRNHTPVAILRAAAPAAPASVRCKAGCDPGCRRPAARVRGALAGVTDVKKSTRVNHPPDVSLPADNRPLVAPIYQSVKFDFDTLEETRLSARRTSRVFLFARRQPDHAAIELRWPSCRGAMTAWSLDRASG